MNDKELYDEIEKRQKILDDAWGRPPQYYINGKPVSHKEYWEYQEEQKQIDAQNAAEISFYRRCTSTGEEWEVDSDGEYTPDWLNDR